MWVPCRCSFSLSINMGNGLASALVEHAYEVLSAVCMGVNQAWEYIQKAVVSPAASTRPAMRPCRLLSVCG